MAVLLDIDDDDMAIERYDSGYDSSRSMRSASLRKPIWIPEPVSRPSASVDVVQNAERPNPNINGFSAALSCYPIVSQLASQLDLNTLDSLSKTCRQIRANLLEYRTHIIGHTLRCSREQIDTAIQLAERLREMQTNWLLNAAAGQSARLTSGRVGQCARDLVGDCRRCGKAVCRNCIAKPFSQRLARDRHRRLCRTCIHAPLSQHSSAFSVDPATLSSSPSHIRHIPVAPEPPVNRAFTDPAFERTPCDCLSDFWICIPCGYKLRSNDQQYSRTWAWRTNYCAARGGLGTGIGTGIEAVKCGRDAACLAAKVVEQEVDCDPDDLAAYEMEADRVEKEGTGRSWKGTSYLIQEVEGIGGVVKKKAKKMVRVGQYVEEHRGAREREKEYLGASSSSPLEREVSGQVRSWCAWCDRVIPSKGDLEAD